MSLKSYKDIDEGRKRRNEYKKQYRTINQNGSNVGKYYTPDEDRKIMEHKVSDRELSIMLGRQISAIQIRRNRLKKGCVPNGHIKKEYLEKVRTA